MVNDSTKLLGPYVFEDIGDGVLLLSGDGTVAYMNKSAQEMLSITSDQTEVSLPGLWLQQPDPRNDNLCQTVIDALYDKKSKINKRVQFYNTSNENRVLNIKSSYWSDPSGESNDGVLLIVRDITDETHRQKERDDAIWIFSILLAAIGIWTLFYAALTQFGAEMPRASMTYILLGFGLILAWVIHFRTDLKIADCGLSFNNVGKHILVNLAITAVVCSLMILTKLLIIKSGSDIFPKDQPFFDFTFTSGMKLYPRSVLLQEFLSQGIIHECLMKILKGKHSKVLAILLSAILFTVLHIHRGFGFMIGSLFLVCIIGIIYRKQRTIWGLCITHYSISMMAYFLNWL